MEKVDVDQWSNSAQKMEEMDNKTKPVKLEELYCDACQQSCIIASLLRCSKCKSVYYCGKECQKKHWKEHKTSCQQYVNIQEEITAREEHVQSILSSCCIYSINEESTSSMQMDVENSGSGDDNPMKVFDAANSSPNTCQICYEVIPMPTQTYHTFPSCSHGFCMNCIQSYFTLLEEDQSQPSNHEFADSTTPEDKAINPTNSSNTHRCPLCRNDGNLFDPTQWQFAYSNTNDFLFQRSLFPPQTIPHTHYTTIAKREFKRLLALIKPFPPHLAPLQFDLLRLKMMPIIPFTVEQEKDGKEKEEEPLTDIINDPLQIHQELKSFCEQLLQREIKDISCKLEIYKTYLDALLHLQETKEAKKLCDTVLAEISQLPKPTMMRVMASSKCQEIVNSFQFHHMDLLLLSVIDDESNEGKLATYGEVIRLAKQGLQKNRHDGRLYELLSRVYSCQGDEEEASLILQIGLRYVLPWDKKSVDLLQQAYHHTLESRAR